MDTASTEPEMMPAGIPSMAKALGGPRGGAAQSAGHPRARQRHAAHRHRRPICAREGSQAVSSGARRRAPHAPAVHGVVIGDGPLREELEPCAPSLGSRGAISFLGERQDVVRLMAGLDAFMLPSIIEGFPNALLEAVFLGVPSVATSCRRMPGRARDEAPHVCGRRRGWSARALATLMETRSGVGDRRTRAQPRARDVHGRSHDTHVASRCTNVA